MYCSKEILEDNKALLLRSAISCEKNDALLQRCIKDASWECVKDSFMKCTAQRKY